MTASLEVGEALLILKLLFLVLLYVFIWRVIRSAGRDMRAAPQESFILAPSQLAAEHPSPGIRRTRRASGGLPETKKRRAGAGRPRRR